MKQPTKTYQIQMPTVPEKAETFTFRLDTPEGSFAMSFRWNRFRDMWSCLIELPSGERRCAGIIPNNISWRDNDDFGFYLESNLPAIGQNDLALCAMYILRW